MKGWTARNGGPELARQRLQHTGRQYPKGDARDRAGQPCVDNAFVADLMLRLALVVSFVLLCQVGNGMYGHSLLAEAEQQRN